MNSEDKRIEESIDQFALAMKQRMFMKAREGFSGWNNVKYEKVIKKKLLKNVLQLNESINPSAIDVANFAMMLWKMNLSKTE